MTEDQIRELLREMGREPVPPDSLARVRLAVARGIEQQSRMPALGARARLAAVGLAIAAVLIAIAVRPVKQPTSQSVRPAPRPQPAATAAVAAPPSDVSVRRTTAARRRRAESMRRQVEAPAAESLVIRIETPDPDVVILLVGESAGW